MVIVDKQSRIPIYEQILQCVKTDIINNELKADEQIPSVRSLSLELSVNPNTIQKAYAELEHNNITYSVPGVGRFVSKDAVDIIRNEMFSSNKELCDSIQKLKLAGLSLDEIVNMVKEIYGGKIYD